MNNCNSSIAAANSKKSGNNDAEEHCSSWVGIDLGTTNSCVAVWRNDRVEVIANAEGHNLTPSCVSFMPGEPEPIVGYCAKQKRFSNPENTIFEMKRLFGRDFNDPFVQNMIGRWTIKIVDDGHGKPSVELESGGNIRHIRPLDIQSLVLGKMRATAERRLGRPVTKAVITVPAYFNSDAKAETMEAARLAGFEEDAIQLLHEPTAAAYYYGSRSRKFNDYRLLVFDLGGGTFDVTILHVLNNVFLEKGIDGINHLGGQDFDWAMFELVAKKIREQYGPTRNVIRDKGTGPYLWAQCQQCKERLSSCSQARLDVSEVFADLDGEVIIEREKYEACIRPLVESAMEKVRRLLVDCKMQAKEVNEVLLVGGSTRLPLVQEMLKREFGNIHLNMSVNTDEAVACGAAIYAAKQCENVRDGIPYMMSIIEATPLSLGVSGKDGRCRVLIERNTPLPATGTMRFQKKYITKSSMSTHVRIYEGERLLEKGKFLMSQIYLFSPGGFL